MFASEHFCRLVGAVQRASSMNAEVEIGIAPNAAIALAGSVLQICTIQDRDTTVRVPNDPRRQ
jgi:hypothetical protein